MAPALLSTQIMLPARSSAALLLLAGISACTAFDGASAHSTEVITKDLTGGQAASNAEAAPAPAASPAASPAIVDIAAGTNHTCALWSDGAVQCWGGNNYGQLGLGESGDFGRSPAEMQRVKPVRLGDAKGKAVGITAGAFHTCVLFADGRVSCWGSDMRGQLGDGSTEVESHGLSVTDLGDSLPYAPIEKVEQIAAGSTFTCARIAGLAHCWGGSFGLKPAPQYAAARVVATSLVTSPDADFLCALGASGPDNLHCWNDADLGLGRTGGHPEVLDNVATSAVSVGVTHACALDASSPARITCWGWNDVGQLIASADPTAKLATINAGAAKNIVVGDYSSCGVSGSQVKCYGASLTAQTKSIPPRSYDFGKAVTKLVIGSRHACVLLEGSSVVCWGDNAVGQIGIGSSEDVLEEPDVAKPVLLSRGP